MNNIEHMCISIIGPSSMITTKQSSVETLLPKKCQEVKAKRDGVINPISLNFNPF